MRSTIVSLSALGLIACGAPVPEGGATLLGENLRVSGQAALEPCSDCPELTDDSTSSSTPALLHIGVAEVELLRAADDPSPVRIVTHEPATDADLVAGARFADIDLGAVPEGVYTHLRVKLDWIRFQVEATAHSYDLLVPGDVDTDYALSAHQSADGGWRAQGEYTATFTAFGAGFPQTGDLPVEYPPPYPEGTVSTADDRYTVTMVAPEGPIVINHDTPESVDADVTYFIADAFGWVDRDEPGYEMGCWDISPDPLLTERPARMAIAGFSMDVTESTEP